ncbi:MAG: hypothetical protein L0G99_18250, partial [Propionibacteriales bacterium]|nr:hypothetical protein [Propionibacteriales bacterium]
MPRGAVVREPLRRAAESATGVRAEFRTDATAITLPVRVTGTPRPMIDVLADGELVHRRQLGEGLNEVATPLSGAPADVEVWLPQDGRVSVGDLTLTGAGIVDIGRPARRRWYAYGSSITHCLAAAGPSQTWPSMVARRNGWDLTCLGFNG